MERKRNIIGRRYSKKKNIIGANKKKSNLITIYRQLFLSDKPMDHIFFQRKRKIAQSMRKKPETDTASTQTKIAGFPEVEKLKEQLEIPCSVCTRESECRWCSGSQQDFNLQEEVKILKTQDILLAYRPCYTRTSPAAAKVYNNPVNVLKKDKKVFETCSKCSVSKTTSSDYSNKTLRSADSEKRKRGRKSKVQFLKNPFLPFTNN